MIGDTIGYCVLRSVHTIVTSGNPEDYLCAPFLRIIDTAVDNNGFMLLAPNGCSIAIVTKSDVQSFFFCEDFNGILIPPSKDILKNCEEASKRVLRKGGYNVTIKKMVILTSLRYGMFNDNFLFEQ